MILFHSWVFIVALLLLVSWYALVMYFVYTLSGV